MARSSITLEDIIGKAPTSLNVSAGINLSGFIKFRADVSTSQISSRFEAAINRASNRAAIDLKRALDDALRSGVWSTGGNDNDLYDSGELMESGVVSVNNNIITVAYSAPYAALIHYGGYINVYGNTGVKVYLPPRKWVEAVMIGGGPVPKFDLKKYYQEEVRAAFR